MSNTFYGEFIKEKFPARSRIRKDSSSTGAKLFDGLGTFIEKNYRSKLLQEKNSPLYSGSLGTNSLANLYETQLVEDNDFQSKVNGFEVEKTKVTLLDGTSSECAFSIEELYNSKPESYTSKGYFTNQVLIAECTSKNYIKEITYNFTEETEIFVNVKEITSTYKNKEKPYIKLCGKNIHGVPLEESIYIEGEGLYKTKSKFFTLESISRTNKVTGGLPVNIYGLKEFSLEVLAYSAQSFVENKTDYRDENKTVKKKRVILKNFLSKAKSIKSIPNGFSDNNLIVELVNYEDTESDTYESYLYYIHNYYKEPEKVFSENNVETEREVFEAVIGFVLLDQYVIDLEYNYETNDLITCTAEGAVYHYDMGLPEMQENAIQRTHETKLEIAFEDSRYLPNESMIGRLITTNLDFPIFSFILGKIEGGNYTFLNADKTAFEEDVNIFNSLAEAEDLQDSITSISFDITTPAKEISSIEFFTICFPSTGANLNKINEYNLLDATSKRITILVDEMEDTYINSRVLSCGYLTSSESYTELVTEPQFIVKNIYKVNSNRNIVLVGEENTHMIYEPVYNQHYYYNQSIYSTENKTITNVEFTMKSGGEVVNVDLNQ